MNAASSLCVRATALDHNMFDIFGKARIAQNLYECLVTCRRFLPVSRNVSYPDVLDIMQMYLDMGMYLAWYNANNVLH